MEGEGRPPTYHEISNGDRIGPCGKEYWCGSTEATYDLLSSYKKHPVPGRI